MSPSSLNVCAFPVADGYALVVKWDGDVGFRLPLRGKCKCDGITGGELLIQLNGETPAIPMAKEDFGSDHYAACRKAVSSWWQDSNRVHAHKPEASVRVSGSAFTL